MEEQDIPPAEQTEGGSDTAQSTRKPRRKVKRGPTADQRKRKEIWDQVIVPALNADAELSAPAALTLLQSQAGDLTMKWSISQVQRRMTDHHRAKDGAE